MNVKRFDSEGREINDKPSAELNYERTRTSDWPTAFTMMFAVFGVVAVCAIAAWWTK